MARVADSLTLVGVQVKGFIDVAGPGLLAGVAEGIINDKVKDALSSNDVHASRPVVTEQRATSMNRSHPQPFSRTAPLRSAKGS